MRRLMISVVVSAGITKWLGVGKSMLPVEKFAPTNSEKEKNKTNGLSFSSSQTVGE